MVKYCSARGCKNRFVKGRGITFHSFPHKNKELLEKWVRAVRRENWQPSKYSTLCSEHFIPADFYPCQRRTQIKEDVVPSIFVNAPPAIKLPKEEQISDSSIGEESNADLYLRQRRTEIKEDVAPSIFLNTPSPIKLPKEEPISDSFICDESDADFYLCQRRTQIKDDLLDTSSLMDLLQEEPVLDGFIDEESEKISSEITRDDYLNDLK